MKAFNNYQVNEAFNNYQVKVINQHLLGSCHSFLFTPPQWDGQENQGAEVGKPIVWDKAGVICKAKLCMQAKQHVEFMHCFPWASRCLAVFRRAPSGTRVIWEHKCRDSEVPPSSLWRLSMTWQYGLSLWIIHLGQLSPLWSVPCCLVNLGQLSPLCSLSAFCLPHPICRMGADRETGKALTLYNWLCWSTAKTSACYQHCFQFEIQNTAPDRLLQGKLTPSHPYPVHDFMV